MAEILGMLRYPDSFLDCIDLTTPFGKFHPDAHLGFDYVLICLKYYGFYLYSSQDFGREGGGDEVRSPGVLLPALTLLLCCQPGLLQPDIKWQGFNMPINS